MRPETARMRNEAGNRHTTAALVQCTPFLQVSSQIEHCTRDKRQETKPFPETNGKFSLLSQGYETVCVHISGIDDLAASFQLNLRDEIPEIINRLRLFSPSHRTLLEESGC